LTKIPDEQVDSNGEKLQKYVNLLQLQKMENNQDSDY
jgi:hypothetical protein